MRRVALAFVVACIASAVACGSSDALQAAGFGGDEIVAVHDAGVADATIASNVDANASEIVTGGGGSGATGSGGVFTGPGDDDDASIADAGTDAPSVDAADAAPTVDAGPCEASSFFELWTTESDGTWVPGTNWTYVGPAPTIVAAKGAFFTTNAVSYLSKPLLPTCRYNMGLGIIPPTPIPGTELTYATFTNTNPAATLTFTLSSSLDDAGVLRGVITVRMGGTAISSEEVDLTGGPNDNGMPENGADVLMTTRGTIFIGSVGHPDTEYLTAPDGTAFGGFTEIKVGIVDGPTTTQETLNINTDVGAEWNDTL